MIPPTNTTITCTSFSFLSITIFASSTIESSFMIGQVSLTETVTTITASNPISSS